MTIQLWLISVFVIGGALAQVCSPYWDKIAINCDIVGAETKYCNKVSQTDGNLITCTPYLILKGRSNNRKSWMEVKNGTKCQDQSIVAVISDGQSSEPLKEFQCRRKDMCKMALYYHEMDCDQDKICKQPFENEISSCDRDFDLEVKYEGGAKWEPAAVVYCNGEKGIGEMVVRPKNLIMPRSFSRVRCIKQDKSCNVDDYFDPASCKREEKCTKPDNYKCPSDVTLEAKFTWGGKWEEVPFIECDGKKLVKKLTDTTMTPVLLRCLKKSAECEVEIVKYFDNTNCPEGDKCIAPTKSDTVVSCPPNHSLEFLLDGEETWIEGGQMKCYNDGIFNDDDTLKNNFKLRCRKKRNCDMEKYKKKEFIKDCVHPNVCRMPKKSQSSSQFECDPSFELQMKTFEKEEWRKIDSVECADKRFRVTENGVEVKKVPIHFRCVREKKCVVEYYFDGIQEEIRVAFLLSSQPVPDNLKCDPGWLMQARKTEGDKWVEISLIACSSKEELDVTLREGGKVLPSPSNIRCMRKKCAECDDPCDGSPTLPLGCGIEFTPSQVWHQCATFKCKDQKHNLLMFGNENHVIGPNDKFTCASNNSWAIKDTEKTGKAYCTDQKTCSSHSKGQKVRSTCDANLPNHLCQPVEVKDYTKAKCENGKIIHRKDGKENVVLKVECNLKVGKYQYLDSNNRRENVTDSDSFFCKYEECKGNLSKIFEEVSNCYGNEECKEYIEVEVNKFMCPDGFLLRTKRPESDWKDENEDAYFKCGHGRLLLGEYKIDEKMRAKCSKDLYCTDRNPIKSECKSDYCEQIQFDNHGQTNCETHGRGYSLVVEGIEGIFEFLECDKSSGDWKVTDFDGHQEEINDNSNVYCLEEGGAAANFSFIVILTFLSTWI